MHPAKDLPEKSVGSVPGRESWLLKAPVKEDAKNIKINGVDGIENQLSKKGAYISFESEVNTNYQVEIKSKTIPESFPKKIISGSANAGVIKAFWDGTDGNGQPIPEGNNFVEINVQLQLAEVHFPFFDLEYNVDGIIIELLDPNDLNNVVSDLIYWNDTDIPNVSVAGNNPSPKNNSHLHPIYSQGISSNINGRKFAQSFGDARSLDTWTFIKSDPVIKYTIRVLQKF